MTKNLLVSEDGQYTIIMAILNESLPTLSEKRHTMNLTKQSLEKFSKDGIQFNVLSEAFVSTEFYDLTLTFLIKYAIISFIISTLIILVIFKSLSILLFMSCNQICGLLIFPLIFYINYTDINVYTVIIIPLISAIQLTFLTHFYSVFRQHIHSELKLQSIFKKCLSVTFLPSLLAMLTTAIGLISLYFSDISIIQNVGSIGLQALIAVFILTFLPPFLISLKAPFIPQDISNTNIDKKYNRRFLKPAKVISGALIITAFLCTFFIQQIQIDVRTKEFLQVDSETRQSIELIDQKIGGVNVFELKVKTNQPGRAQSYECLKFCHEFRKTISQFPEINSAYSYSQLYTVIHQLFLGDNFSIGNIFPPPLQATLYSQIINSQKFPFQNILQNEDLSETTLFIRTQDLSSKDFLVVIQKVLKTAKQMAPEGISITVKNGLHSLLASDRKTVNSQIKSLSYSLTGIFILFLLIWRSWRLAITALAVNTLPLILLFGSMAFLSISLNSINIMVAVIVLGISVDDSIHFICYMSNLLRNGKSFQEALVLTLNHKFKPILCTSLILASCLSLFYLAPFPPIQTFGLLGASSLLIAMAATLILLPVLLHMRKNTLFKRKE